MNEPSISGATAVDPDLCRVSVIGGNTQIDLGLPATIPIAAFISDVVELIETRNPDLTDPEDGRPPQAQHWTLARVGRDPISPNRSLTESEVYDGELLVLRSVTAKESPALFDDVIDAVSKLTAVSFRSWSAVSAQWMGLLGALVAVLSAVGLLAVAKVGGASFAIGFIGAGAGALALGAAVIAARRYAATVASIMLSLLALVLFAAAAALFVPGDFGSPHLLFGSVTLLVAAVAGYSVTRVGALLYAGALTLGLFGASAAAVRMIWDSDAPKIAAGVLVAALIVITMVPRFAVASARLPVPPVPTAGAAIDPADHEPRPTIEDIGAVGATALPSTAGLEHRARVANQYQSGIVLGATVAAATSALLAADPMGSARWQGITLAVLVALILCLRGRSFADLVQASTLIAGGFGTLIALTAAVALGQPSWQLPIAGLLLVMAAVAMVFGVIGPHTEMTPVVRRMGELFEYAMIIGIIPLVFWIMNLYSLARNR